MKTQWKMLLFLTVFLLAGMVSFQAYGAGQGEEAKAKTMSLTGQINDSGELNTEEGEEFELTGDLAGELQGMGGKNVEVWGTMKEENGYHTIEVQDYRELK